MNKSLLRSSLGGATADADVLHRKALLAAACWKSTAWSCRCLTGPLQAKLPNDGLARRLRNPACQQSGTLSPCWNSIHACFRRRQLPAIPRDRAHKLWSQSMAS
jgi:hypothetical protein